MPLIAVTEDDPLPEALLAEARARKNRKTISLEDVERELGLVNGV